MIRLPAPRTRKRRWWTVDEARLFLESTRLAQEPLCAAFVLILLLGLRKGEVLGLTWELVNLDAAELQCCTSKKNGQSQGRNWPLSWVGDTGIEPVTSSV